MLDQLTYKLIYLISIGLG